MPRKYVEHRLYQTRGQWFVWIDTTPVARLGPYPTKAEARQNVPEARNWGVPDPRGRPKQTECKNGHSLTDPANVYIDVRGYPVCRACRAEARYNARMAAREQQAQHFIDKAAAG